MNSKIQALKQTPKVIYQYYNKEAEKGSLAKIVQEKMRDDPSTNERGQRESTAIFILNRNPGFRAHISLSLIGR